MFDSPKQAFVTRHDSIAASQEWYHEFFNDDGMKQLFDELQETERSVGQPVFDGWNDTFFNEIPLED